MLPRQRRQVSEDPEPGWSELATQVLLIACAVFFYFQVRGLTEGAQTTAVANGHDILAFERATGIAVEHSMQAHVVDSQWLTTLANWVYIWLHWPMIIATLLWLHRHQRPHYRVLRDAMFVSGAIGLVIFVLYPVAPPRLLGVGLVDTVTDLSTSYRVLQPPSLTNKYAAMPSLHVGWNLLVGIALWRASSRWPIRVAAVVGPTLMALAVVATANHYAVDGIVGAMVTLVGLFVAERTTVPIADRTNLWLRRRQGEVVENDTVDPSTSQPFDGLDVVDAPGEQQAPSGEAPNGLVIEQTSMHHGTIDLRPGRQPEQQQQLEAVTGRTKRPNTSHPVELTEKPPGLG